MRNIKVIETVWDIKSLYKEATTPARRALAGYMLKTGKTNDLLLGAAFTLLREVERCKNRLYNLSFAVMPEEEKQIVAAVEIAMNGGFKKFALSKREIKRTLKRINDYV